MVNSNFIVSYGPILKSIFTVAVNFPDGANMDNAKLECFSHVPSHTWGDGRMVSVRKPFRMYIAM